MASHIPSSISNHSFRHKFPPPLLPKNLRKMRRMMKLSYLQLFMVAFHTTLITMSSAGLQNNFYSSLCPNAEATITSAVYGIIDADPTMAAALLRLHFHDCFVQGCDGSILLNQSSNNTNPEKSLIPLRGYDAVDKIKAAVEAVCPGTVSCADILAFAARDSVAKSSGFAPFAVPSGRRDGTTSAAVNILTGIPSPSFGIQDLVGSFTRKGLNVDDLVALSGAHSIGEAHCSAVTGRLYPSVDPAMNASYAAYLKTKCPAPTNHGPDPMVNNSDVAPTTLGNQYYASNLAGRVLFSSDAALLNRTDTAAKVANNAANQTAWMSQFVTSLIKMGNIQVLTGTQGQVRRYCYATN